MMPKKLSHEEFINKIKLIHGTKFTFLNQYQGSQHKILVHCNCCGVDFNSTPNILLSGRGCKKCSINKITKSSDEFLIQMKKLYGEKFTLVGEYNKTTDFITVLCNIHNECKTLRARTFLKGNTGCKKCTMRDGRKHVITTEEYINKIKLNPKFENYDFTNFKYINTRTKSNVVCDKGHEILITPASMNSGRGCPSCALHTSTSKPMFDIIKILNKHEISFEREKTFDNCINKQKLPFDIYLKDYNICIEYDGKQHYEVFEHWGGKAEFESRVLNDNIKTTFCLKNNIKLYRIRYDQNHIKIINEIIGNLK